MKMIKQIKNFFNNYKLVFLGFLLFSLYFWNRFLRYRTSKLLPLNLSILGFFMLLYTCMIFFYIIISLLFPKKSNDIMEKVMDWFFTPLAEFDKFLKTISRIKKYYDMGLHYLLPKLEYFIIQTNILFIILWIIPRMLLVSVLWADIFLFHKLHYKYYIIFVGILLFFNRYFKYSLKNYKNQLIEENKIYLDGVETPYVFGIHPSELAPDYDPEDEDNDEIPPVMYLPIEIFVKFQTESMVYQGITRKCRFIGTKMQLHRELWEKYIHEPYVNYSHLKQEIPKNYKNIFGEHVPNNYYKAQSFIREKKKEFAKATLNKIIRISVVLEYYNKTSNFNEKIKILKILIYINYLFCWLYVLIVSIQTLDLEGLIEVLNNTWLGIENPFN